MSPVPRVGWIGLGSMGIGMSKNLQLHLTATSAPPLTFTNRTMSRGKQLESLGAVPASTVSKVTHASDIIFSCVSNDAVLQSITDEIIASGPLAGKIYMDCSTVHPDTTVSVSRKIIEAGGQFIAGPVFGASPVAAAGALIFVLAGPADAIQKVTPYVTGVMGKSIISMGSEVSKSALLKIAGNICVVSFMEVISEAQVFAERTGLGADVLEPMIGQMFGPTLESYAHRLTSGNYAPSPSQKAGFDVSLAIKDARHALKCADSVGVSLDVSQIALRHMVEATELQGDRPLDSSCMYGTIRHQSGLDFFSDVCRERDGGK